MIPDVILIAFAAYALAYCFSTLEGPFGACIYIRALVTRMFAYIEKVCKRHDCSGDECPDCTYATSFDATCIFCWSFWMIGVAYAMPQTILMLLAAWGMAMAGARWLSSKEYEE